MGFIIFLTCCFESYYALEALTTEALAAIAAAQDLATLDQARVQFTGKKSQLAEQSKALGKMDPEERKVFGRKIHAVREAITGALTTRQAELQKAALEQNRASEDRHYLAVVVKVWEVSIL